MKKVTSEGWYLIASALRIAADQYDKDALENPEVSSLVGAFRALARDARRLAEIADENACK